MQKNKSEAEKAENISTRKWKQIRSEAADLGITPEEHLIRQAEKELKDLKKKYATTLNKSQQIAALNWAAEKEKTTPKAIIDKYHNANYDAFKKFGMSF